MNILINLENYKNSLRFDINYYRASKYSLCMYIDVYHTNSIIPTMETK